MFIPKVVAAVLVTSVAALHSHIGVWNQKPQRGVWGFDVAGQNTTVRPGDDFFLYANGKYINELVIPADKTSWGSFNILNELTLNQIKVIVEENQRKGTKLGMLYEAYMNDKLVNTLDISPALPMLKNVQNMVTKAQFAQLAGEGQFGFLPAPIGVYIGADQKDPTKHSISVDQSGLGLPDRDYYLDATFADVKEAYSKHLVKMLTMINWPSPTLAASAIMNFETEIAKVSWTSAQMRDTLATYNPMPFTELLSKAPNFDWISFFAGAGLSNPQGNLVVGALSAVVDIAKIVGYTPLETLRSWMAFHYIDGVAPKLSQRFVDASFEFAQKITGQKEQSPRWQRAVSHVSGGMGDELAQAYVAKHFPPSSKTKVEELCVALKNAFRQRLDVLDWMTPATKEKARAKLESQTVAVGYPTKFREYSSLVVRNDDLLGNSKRANEFQWNYWLDQLDKPVDQEMWDGLQAHQVNAYNMPQYNKIVFPAAILQSPFFDPEADMAINFGAIGAVIGHEMMHSFDDQGRHYDAKGQLNDWWTQADATEFDRRAKLYGQQYADFDLSALGVPGIHINPELVMGEALADLGGLTLTADAYFDWEGKKKNGNPIFILNSPPFIGDNTDGLEGFRRVFLGYSQVWRQKTRPESLKNQVTTDPHPPAMARVDVVIRNVDSWYSSFGITPDNKLFLDTTQRARIW